MTPPPQHNVILSTNPIFASLFSFPWWTFNLRFISVLENTYSLGRLNNFKTLVVLVDLYWYIHTMSVRGPVMGESGTDSRRSEFRGVQSNKILWSNSLFWSSYRNNVKSKSVFGIKIRVWYFVFLYRLESPPQLLLNVDILL